MLLFKNWSIRTKIIVLIVFVSTINVLFSSLIYFKYDKDIFHEDIRQKLIILAKVVGENNLATVVFNKPNEAKENLQTLNTDEHVEMAQIIVEGNVFVSYKKNDSIVELVCPISAYADTVVFFKEKAIVNTPLSLKGDTIAEIRIQYSTQALHEKLSDYYKIILIIVLITIVVAIILAYLAQKKITSPIINLHRLMDIIKNKKDYSLRSENTAKDEIGQLSIGFNEMLRQIEIKNNELSHQKELAEASLKAKEQFLANMTHELRTPLNSIIGLASLLYDTPLSEEQKKYLENIKLSSDHLLVIINDLLEFSRIGSGKLQFEENEFSIRLSIERIKNTMQYEIKKRNLNFSYSVEKNVPHIVVGDDYRLNQILLNLVGNAIKFTPEGKIEILVKKIFETEYKVGIEFSVKDTGIGIRKEKQKLIFESFTQENYTTTRKYGGTGLGLAITKQLVELQGGEIKLDSEKGKGSTFIFSIPYLKRKTGNNIAESVLQKLGKFEKILLIDDNEMNLLFTKSILEKSNFIVETANNAKEALDKLFADDFSIILMDLYMPEVDGFELTQKIRSLKNLKFKKIPIIALTAAATVNEINKCFDTGMNDYLIKPFKKDELISKILNLLQK